MNHNNTVKNNHPVEKFASDVAIGEWIEYEHEGKWSWYQVNDTVYDALHNSSTLTFKNSQNGNNQEFTHTFLYHEKVLTSHSEPINIPERHNVPSWTEYFLHLAEATSKRAKCRRRMVGAVLVDDQHRVIGTGYNGFPVSGSSGDCLTGACPRGLMSNDEVKAYSSYDNGAGLCIASHAEVQALAYRVKDSARSTIYVTDKPCFSCCKALYSHMVRRAVWGTKPEESMEIHELFEEYVNNSK